MAQLILYRPQNMGGQWVDWYSPGVDEASASRIVVSDRPRATIYEGTFVYATGGVLSGGTLTAVTQTASGSLDYAVAGLSVDVAVAADFINSGDMTDLLSIGLNGDDVILGSAGTDTLVGYAGNDVVRGNGGSDSLYGYAGNDVIVGGDGPDSLYGGTEGDLLLGGGSNDVLHGGDGVDTAGTAALRNQVTVSTPRGFLKIQGPEGLDDLTAIEAIRFADGTVHLGPDSVGAGVHRLYLATLGRAPDAPGLGAWAAAIESGAISAKDAAAGFAGSAEFAQRYGAPDAAGFVSLLYQNVLGRAPDEAGLNHWAGGLNGGSLTRPDVVLGFSDSAEFKTKTAPALGNGLWAPDPAAVDVVRVYLATLDRLPDAGGLAHWINAQRSGGVTTQQMEAAFIGSNEFATKYGATSNAAFVDLLYRNVLDRGADADGLAFWSGGLDAGRVSRAEVVHGFAFSNEMTAKIAPHVSDGVAFV